MTKRFFKKAFVFAVFYLSFTFFPSLVLFADDAPIQVHGDTVEYFQEEQKAVGTGHVTIDYDQAHLAADKITVYMATKQAVAEGNVVLTQKGSIFRGQKATYNFGTKVGDVSGMSAEIAPSYYGKVERVERISETHTRASNGYVTTCCGDNPFYKIQSQQVDIYPEDKIVVRNAVLFIKGVPVFFIPYFVHYFIDFDRFPVQLIPGKNSDWGAFLLSKWRYHLVNQPSLQDKGNILLDTREKRGFGYGVENFYKGDRLGRGAARVYFVDDDNPPAGEGSDRNRVQWRHQSKIGEATTLTTEFNKLSDPQFIKDFFFREEYERDAFPDNYVSVITSKPEYTFSVLARNRVDHFVSVVERSPELRFDTHNRQFMDTPFYLREEIQFSNLSRRFSGQHESLDAVRLDVNHTLSYAGRIGPVSVTPRIGSRETYYSRDSGDKRDLVRSVLDPGVDVSTRFYKTYDIYIHSFGLDYNQIRHVFTPTVSYNFRRNPTVSRTTLQPFDSLDALDKRNLLRFAFENKLQTKERTSGGESSVREIARIIPFFDHDYDTGHLENVGLDVELRPYSWLGIETDVSYNTRTDKAETANFDVYFGQGNLKWAVGQRYVQDASSQTTAQVQWKIHPEWDLKVYERYEFEENESKEFELAVSKYFDCVILDFIYNHKPEKDAFYFALRLKAFPSFPFSISKTYGPPKAAQEESGRFI